jgi:DNA-binding SARP family transcriptional activator/TolB-like protein/protein involved in temperature-dependent protein secretion
MLKLEVLGRARLTESGGHDIDQLLRQPKRFALLVYLALPEPGTWHRRDTLLANFWPEFDAARARTALRNALYILRGHLGEAVVRSRGNEEVSLDPALISCDAGEFLEHCGGGRWAEALAGYDGDLLPGFFAADAGGFESWLESERARLRELARAAAEKEADRIGAGDDVAEAMRSARRALELNPASETGLRRLLRLLDRAGDRAGAMAAFEAFQKHMTDEFGALPSPESLALIDGIRTRAQAGDTGADVSFAAATDGPAPSAAGAPEAPTESRRRWRPVALVGALVVLLGIGAAVAMRRGGSASPAPLTLLILPMENLTHNAGDDYLADGLAEDLLRRLEQVPGLRVTPGTRAVWLLAPGADRRAIARRVGATQVLASKLDWLGDSISVRAEVREASTGRVDWSTTMLFAASALPGAASRLSAAVAGGVLGNAPPAVPSRPVNAESYRLTIQGWHNIMGGAGGEGFEDGLKMLDARARLIEAVNIDPSNARAWSGIASIWSSLSNTGVFPPNDGFANAEQAARRALALDSTQGSAWGTLGFLRAYRDGDLPAGDSLFRRGMAFEPTNAELPKVLGALYRFAGQWDQALDLIRLSERLDPLMPPAIGREANTLLCAGRAEEALRVYREQLAMDPTSREGRRGVVQSFARLGQWDSATAGWRAIASRQGDTVIVRLLKDGSGKAGYEVARLAEGRQILARIRDRMKEGWLAPYHLARAMVQAGDVEAGLKVLEQEVQAGVRPRYQLACMPGFDAIRDDPRFLALLERVPPLGRRGARP